MKKPQTAPSEYGGPIQTRRHADRYYGGKTIQCLLCKKRFGRLASHLAAKHHITSDEYRITFGLPWTRGLTSAASHANSGWTKRRRAEASKAAKRRRIFDLAHRSRQRREASGLHQNGRGETPGEVCCESWTTLRTARACSVQKGPDRRGNCIGPPGQPDDCQQTDQALAKVRCCVRSEHRGGSLNASSPLLGTCSKMAPGLRHVARAQAARSVFRSPRQFLRTGRLPD
jgi:ROS/MUCR transcriptional regulator protein